jgi:hypothetical protein
MKVGIFYNSISNPNKFSNKVLLMDNFSTGVRACGDIAMEYKTNSLSVHDLDAGFILGYTLERNFRKLIIDTLKEKNIPRIFVDSNILHYAKSEHEWHRYSLNSVYPNDGVYFFDLLNNNKWNIFSDWHNVDLKPWRDDGEHILLLCQRPKGWNMFNNNQEQWIKNTIKEIRNYSSRPIVVRLHPGDGTKEKQIAKLKYFYRDKIQFSQNSNIKDDLKNCWCAVGYNSTPNVVSAIEGVPVYVEDPVHSWAQDIAFTDLREIENPPMPDRSEWINKIANIHWSNEEVKSGKLWSAIKNYIETSR